MVKYIRDVIVPRMNDPNKFKDVDIWFRNNEDRDAFIHEMGEALMSKNDYKSKCYESGFNRVFGGFLWSIKIYSRWCLCCEWSFVYSTWISLYFYLFVCQNNPVGDSNINKITISSNPCKDGISAFKSYCDLTVEEVIKLISDKHFELSQEYIDYMRNHPRIVSNNLARLENELLDCGWKLFCPVTKNLGQNNSDMLNSLP